MLISAFGYCPECNQRQGYSMDDRCVSLYSAPEVDRMVRRELAAHDKACADKHEQRRQREQVA